MTDDEPVTGGERGEPTRNLRTLSRRRTLASLLGFGTLGLADDTTGTLAGKPGDVVRSDDDWVVEVGDERGLRLEVPGTFAIEDERYTAGGNVLFGHLNGIREGALGATIGGGGMYVHRTDSALSNHVTDHFGTVGGGAGNRAGNEDGEPRNALFATVGGGARNRASGTRSTVAGGYSNEATGGRAAIGGGINNEASEDATAVGGGIGNRAAGTYATVAGGGGNVAGEEYAAVGGGRGNKATAAGATVAGGRKNLARGDRATVGGGYYNKADGYGATIPGGKENVADGRYSFAVGYEADADGHDGAYVFADSSDESLAADSDDAAYFQMPVQARSFKATSSRAAKTDTRPVDAEAVLDGVTSLDLQEWSFGDGDDEDADHDRHLGPMAEDFQETFGLGADDGTIASVDAAGVALAAIQGLERRLDAKDDRIEELEATVAEQNDRLERLESRLSTLEAQVGEAPETE